MKPEFASLIPKPLQGVTLSKRFIIVVLAGGVLFLSLFAFLLYSQSHSRTMKARDERPIDESISKEHIVALMEQPYVSYDRQNENKSKVKVESVDAKWQGEHYFQTSSLTPDKLIQSGKISAISVYHSMKGTQNVIPSAVGQPRLKNKTPQNVRFTLFAGTIIPAILQTAIHSDLPGTVVAKVRRHVFNTTTGNELLIPQGTTLIGQYKSHILFGQNRVVVTWQRLIFPNGESVDLKQEAGVDLEGQSGLHDRVNHHIFRMLGSTMMVSLLNAAGEVKASEMSSAQVPWQSALTASMGEELKGASGNWLSSHSQVSPTITIRAGALFNVLLAHDVHFANFYHF